MRVKARSIVLTEEKKAGKIDAFSYERVRYNSILFVNKRMKKSIFVDA